MINNVLFIQPFEFFKKQLSDKILIWSIYLENFIKSKMKSLNFELLYLPIEQKIGNFESNCITDRRMFRKQMENLINDIPFELDNKTLICISGTTSNQFIPSKVLSEYFQENYKDVIIVFGGSHASSCPKDFHYKGSPIDYIIIGEGEKGLYNLLKKNIKKQKTPKTIISKPINNLDDLPPLDFTLFDGYVSEFDLLGISLSRGCPFNCNFCMEKYLSKNTEQRRWRSYSPKRAIKEIETMLHYGNKNNIDEFGFYDPIFGLQKKWLDKVLNLFNFKNYKSIWLETRLDILNFNLLKKLQEKKFYLMYGLETFSKKLLQIMNKTNNPKRYYDKFNDIFEANKKLEYPYMLNILFNHPGESMESINITFNKLNELKNNDKNALVNYNIKLYSHFPGTYNYNKIYKFMNELGTINYIPKWWKKRKFLKYGSFCIRPTKKLSLRTSLSEYFEKLKSFEKSRISKDSKNSNKNFFKALKIKKGIQVLEKKEEELFNFLDKNKIEIDEK